LFGFGTWVAFGAGRVLIGNGGGFTAGATGGSADAIVVSHTHTGTTVGASIDHSHGFSGSTSVALGFHNHSMTTYVGVNGGSGGTAYVGNDSGGGTGPSEFTSSVDISHSHTFSGNTDGQSVSHTHTFTTDSAGSSGTNANLPPYIVVYMWNRTA
jgi:hypothetical protein